MDWSALAWLLIACINAYTAWLTWKTREIATETKEIAQKTEINTNSLTKQLNEQTALASHAAGREEMRTEVEKAKEPKK